MTLKLVVVKIEGGTAVCVFFLRTRLDYCPHIWQINKIPSLFQSLFCVMLNLVYINDR